MLTLSVAGCDARPDEGPVVVSVIGNAPAITDPSLGPLSAPARQLLSATAQGLVQFDAAGQIEPGIAERWIVIDDGTSYIFRLREAEWSDGSAVTARDVVASLRRQLAPRSRNPLKPFLSAIDEIVEMTPQVIEVRLKRPRPDLLKLFAQPELAILRNGRPIGAGPFRIAGMKRSAARLQPSYDPARDFREDKAEPGLEENVELIGERAGRAIARFRMRQADLVAGGDFADWPVVLGADIAPANRRIDPAAGLFGLAVSRRDGFLGDPRNRAALSAAIDRSAIVQAFLPEWQADVALLPDQLDSAAAPARPFWEAQGRDARLAAARERVLEWRAANNGSAPAVRIALPRGVGADVLFRLLRANLRIIGITATRVPMSGEADLRLVDAVAPYDSARWYLATACSLCSPEASALIEAARQANSSAERASLLAEADRALTEDNAFIPIARPLRWSLVSLRLRQWQANARAWHPLNRLRGSSTVRQ